MANIEFTNNPELEMGKAPLAETVAASGELREWLVDYVGGKHEPTDGQVTVDMVIQTLGEEFPEFLIAVAEENWVRGYQQAINDVEAGEKLINEEYRKREEEEAEESEETNEQTEGN